MASLLNEEYLESCFSELNKHKASGIDGVSLEEYGNALKENIHKLCEKMRKFSYRPQAVRRVGIPKANGKVRMLGIPTVEDKIVQRAIAGILEAIYEPAFLDIS
ncbi:MAG: group II intron reverse transcriptase/maturase, partial [Ignavibacteriaceae bacterium]